MGIAFLLSVILKEFVRKCMHVKIKEYLLNERKSYHVTDEKVQSARVLLQVSYLEI